jgi:hypothetical protein
MPLLALLFDYLPPLSVKNDETCATSQERQRKRAFERNSYIVLVIGGVVLVSALLVTIQYVFMYCGRARWLCRPVFLASKCAVASTWTLGTVITGTVITRTAYSASRIEGTVHTSNIPNVLTYMPLSMIVITRVAYIKVNGNEACSHNYYAQTRLTSFIEGRLENRFTIYLSSRLECSYTLSSEELVGWFRVLVYQSQWDAPEHYITRTSTLQSFRS